MKKFLKKVLFLSLPLGALGGSLLMAKTITKEAVKAEGEVVYDDVWDGTSSSESLEGSGTSSDPYLIRTCADLKKLSDMSNAGHASGTAETFSAHASLLANLDLSAADWTPIAYTGGTGYTWDYYVGSFLGNNHVIKYKFNQTSKLGVGLFGGFKGTLSDLTVEATVKAAHRVGGLAYIINGATISNVTSNVNITVAGTNQSYTGGIAGCTATAKSKITDCVNNGTITSTAGNYVGGILGYCNTTGDELIRCVNNGAVNAGGQYTGGIVSLNKGKITDCTNNADVKTSLVAASSKYLFLGGIVGDANTCTITGSTNNGAISSADQSIQIGYVGGIAGRLGSNSVAKNCEHAAAASVYVKKGAQIGGIAGQCSGTSTIMDCTVKGSVSGDAYVGYLAGYVGAGSKVDPEGCVFQGASLTNHNATKPIDWNLAVGDDRNISVSKYVNGQLLGFASVISGVTYDPVTWTADNSFGYAAGTAKNDVNCILPGKTNVTWYEDADFTIPYVAKIPTGAMSIYAKAVTDDYVALLNDIKTVDVCNDLGRVDEFLTRIAGLDLDEAAMIMNEQFECDVYDHGVFVRKDVCTVAERLTYMEEHKGDSTSTAFIIPGFNETSIVALILGSTLLAGAALLAISRSKAKRKGN